MTAPRYDMPIAFGPSTVPDKSEVPSADVAIISFVTEAEPLRQIMPPGIELAGEPIVSVSCINYRGVDYLGGRDYQEVVISLPARFEERAGPIAGGYAPIMWVSDVGALMAGREYMGFPKLMGNFESSSDETTRRFRVSEYDSPLIEGRCFDLKPMTEDQVARVQAGSQEVRTFGWKHIPGVDGSVDLAYPLVNVMRWNYSEAWTGKGEVLFRSPDSAAAPFSCRVAAFFANLPVKEFRRSFVARGSATIDRAATRRLV
jgi:acetoacetate decarboxylase